jgi:hypothetical protein
VGCALSKMLYWDIYIVYKFIVVLLLEVEWDDNALTLMLTLMLMGSLFRQSLSQAQVTI